MFDFTFEDAELEALNNLLGGCFENNDAQLPIWVYLGRDVWTMDLGTDLHPDTSEHSDEADNVVLESCSTM